MNGKITLHELGNRKLAVYVPASYELKEAAYPVVYVHDGLDLFDPTESDALSELERMFAAEELPELILVGVEPHERIHEFSPWPAASLTGQYDDFGGRGKEYLSELTHTCKPYVDSVYRTVPDAAHTGIVGKSLGGLISIYAGYLYPDVFGRIGSISGSFWFPGFTDFMKKERMHRPQLRIYMDVGTLEGHGKESVQKDMFPLTVEAHRILEDSGFSSDQLKLLVEEGGLHQKAFFTKRFPEALKWLMKERL